LIPEVALQAKTVNGQNKVRVDINVSRETKLALDQILDAELAEDRRRDRPERSKSEVLEMVLRKGIRAWGQTAK
jgi:hypothetical protein